MLKERGKVRNKISNPEKIPPNLIQLSKKENSCSTQEQCSTKDGSYTGCSTTLLVINKGEPNIIKLFVEKKE